MTDEVPIQFFTSSKVKRYLDQVVASGLYGPTVAGAVERLVCGALENMLVAGQLVEIESEKGQ